MFDANLVICDGSADWTFANLNTSDYGTPITVARNAGGFAVLDLGTGKSPVSGLAVVLMLTEAAAAAGDALTVIIEESTTVGFTVPHELGKFDILAATKGVILGSECPATVVMRVAPTLRYFRIDASCTAGDDFGVVYCYVSPYPFYVL